MTALERDAAAVTAGMALLDTLLPGWLERIDLAQLDVRSTHHGVLGQVHPLPGNCWVAWDEWMGAPRSGEARQYGFIIPMCEEHEARECGDRLTRVWRRALLWAQATAGLYAWIDPDGGTLRPGRIPVLEPDDA